MVTQNGTIHKILAQNLTGKQNDFNFDSSSKIKEVSNIFQNMFKLESNTEELEIQREKTTNVD